MCVSYKLDPSMPSVGKKEWTLAFLVLLGAVGLIGLFCLAAQARGGNQNFSADLSVLRHSV